MNIHVIAQRPGTRLVLLVPVKPITPVTPNVIAIPLIAGLGPTPSAIARIPSSARPLKDVALLFLFFLRRK
jgi:hypothetical protein